jgi:DNA-binding CsgD family transcriptional regulator
MTHALVGRDAELAAVDAFLDAGALPGTLLIEGEAGIGKTSLCAAAVAAARDRGFETLVTRAVAAEAALAFTGIEDLLEPVLEEVLEELPAPQARALRVALLLDDSTTAPDARALAVAFYHALRMVASPGPVLVVVDDVQWLDRSSAAMLRFAVRRVADEPVGLLLARRAGHADDVVSELDSVRRLVLGGLSPGAVHRLLRDQLELVLPRPVLRRLHELSGGNPFYALELGRAFEQGTIRLERGEPLPPTLDALVGERLAALPSSTREALAAAAALSRPRLTTVESFGALAPALAANVVVAEGDEIRFTHPLLASAAYGALDDSARRNLHGRLAAEMSDAEEAAWHLALATLMPEASVAAALDEAAAQAKRRGAPHAAAELTEHARRLTSTDDLAALHRRTVAEATYAFAAGDMGRAVALLEKAVDSAQSGPERADALTSLARIFIYEGNQPRAAELARRALAIPAAAPAVRADAGRALGAALFFMRTDLDEAAGHLETARATAEAAGDTWHASEARIEAAVIDALLGKPLQPEDVQAEEWETPLDRPQLARPDYDVGVLYLWNDALEDAVTHLERAYRRALDEGNEAGLAMIVVHLSLASCLGGRWDEARRQANEAYEAGVQSGQRPQQALALAMRAVVGALVGAEGAARADAAQALEVAGDAAMAARIYSVWALGLLDLSLGEFAAVVDRAVPLMDRLECGGVREPLRFAPDYLEALLGLGRLDEVRNALGRFLERAERSDRPMSRAAAYRCGGLLAAAEGDFATAAASFERALEQHGRVVAPFERARTLLAYGGTLRRAKRKRDARELLDAALAELDGLGAPIWAQRTRDVLARIGGRAPTTGNELTATERKVADLVAQGLPNREVAAALFVAPKTVEFHLRNVFRKLGVRSRTELARRKA